MAIVDPILPLQTIFALVHQRFGKKLSIKILKSAEHTAHHRVVKNTGALQAVHFFCSVHA